jgi:hypothetical protein
LADALMFVVMALVERCLAVVWALLRRPILSGLVGVYVGLVVWLGARVVHGLLVCALLVLLVLAAGAPGLVSAAGVGSAAEFVAAAMGV